MPPCVRCSDADEQTLRGAGEVMTVTVHRYAGDSAEWEAFVNAQPEATNYHRIGWKEVVEKSFGHESIYLMARSGSGELCGVLPLVRLKSLLFGNFLVSLPFFNYGGLLWRDASARSALIEAADALLAETGAAHLELRHLGDHGLDLPAKRHKVTMLLTLEQDADLQWRGFNAKLRNQVRKAEKSGLTTRWGGAELLDGFYEVFVRNMRDLGTPVYGRRFFEQVFRQFPDSTRIIAVLQGEEVVAAGIASWYRETLEIPWASSNRDFKSSCPNNLLYWEAIRFAIGEGFRIFDFGRSTEGEGTYRFKEQWGAKPHPLVWQYLLRSGESLPELNPDNPKYSLAIRAWQRLPLWVTRILGPTIVRNIP